MNKVFQTFGVAFMLMANFSFAQTFTLKSKDIGGQMTLQQVLNGFGCTGKNLSPQLSWENVPEGTKSFAITIYDKDAPTGSGWWHWVVFDIPPLLVNSGKVQVMLAKTYYQQELYKELLILGKQVMVALAHQKATNPTNI